MKPFKKKITEYSAQLRSPGKCQDKQQSGPRTHRTAPGGAAASIDFSRANRGKPKLCQENGKHSVQILMFAMLLTQAHKEAQKQVVNPIQPNSAIK